MEHLSQIFHDLVVTLGYPGLFVVMFLGNMGAPAGTEFVMPTAGALAAQGHLATIAGLPGWILVAIVGTVAEVCGATALYAVGYYGGVPVLERYGKYVGFKHSALVKVHGFYERFGPITVFWCRFIPFVRGVASFPAGISRMQKRYFITYTALGSAIFCFGLSYLGNAAGNNLDAIIANLHKLTLVIVIAAVGAAAAAYVIWRARNKKATDDLAA
ncbi:MAG: rane protein DedA family [Candidatus Eremiobacteraeota bacterium]|jgi:membrane protein DedA with SNARE-associated domain|nr:rane protein DedA family [Candidatus Eremiobacteraeota bacterium]